MIKRLKWNVLYAESAQDGEDLSDSSVESVERGTATAQAVLDQLATNDPHFAKTSALQSDTSSSDDDDTNERSNSAQYDEAPEQHQLSNDSDHADYVEWRECDICPGKRFLNDAEVQAHLSSRRHAKALKRYEARANRENSEKPALSDDQLDADVRAFAGLNNSAESDRFPISTSPDSTNRNEKTLSSPQEVHGKHQSDREDQQKATGKPKMNEQEQQKADKRKAAVKRRLRRLKEKKWKKMALEKSVTETPASQEEKQAPDKIIPEKGPTAEEKRERSGKGRREVRRLQDPSSVGTDGGDDVNVEGSPSTNARTPKKRNKRQGKETLRENESDGSVKRRKFRKGRATTATGDVDQDSRR